MIFYHNIMTLSKLLVIQSFIPRVCSSSDIFGVGVERDEELEMKVQNKATFFFSESFQSLNNCRIPSLELN